MWSQTTVERRRPIQADTQYKRQIFVNKNKWFDVSFVVSVCVYSASSWWVQGGGGGQGEKLGGFWYFVFWGKFFCNAFI